MKKIVFLLFIISLITISKGNSKEYILPNDAIRFRIIANSNDLNDQMTKSIIKRKIEEEVFKEIENNNSRNNIKESINSNLPDLNKIVSLYTNDYNIKYGLNYFPEKKYKNVIYPEGNYESLVITLGEGLGENWWCVLYPPLCLIDEENDSIEYDLYIKKIFENNKS